jgi:hypothetical protein
MVLASPVASPVASTGLFYGLHHVAHRRQSATAHVTAGEAFAAGRHHAAAVALQRPDAIFTQEIGNGLLLFYQHYMYIYTYIYIFVYIYIFIYL